MRLGVRLPQSIMGLVLAGPLLWSACTETVTDPNYPPPNQNPNILNLSNATASASDTGVVVDVNLHNVEPIAGVALSIVYDSTVLKPSDTPYLKPARASQMDNYQGNFSTPGVVKFVMLSFSNPPGRIDVGDGPILQLLFDVKPTTPASASQIRFVNDSNPPPEDNQLSDTTGTRLIIPQLENGTFTVQ